MKRAETEAVELPYVPLAEFVGYCKAATVNGRDGEFVMQIAVLRENKYDAMPLTDYEGTTFRFTVERPDYPTSDG